MLAEIRRSRSIPKGQYNHAEVGAAIALAWYALYFSRRGRSSSFRVDQSELLDADRRGHARRVVVQRQ